VVPFVVEAKAVLAKTLKLPMVSAADAAAAANTDDFLTGPPV
jgi:hypothetical protein